MRAASRVLLLLAVVLTAPAVGAAAGPTAAPADSSGEPPREPAWLRAASGDVTALLVLREEAAPEAALPRLAEVGVEVRDRFDAAGVLTVRGSPQALAAALHAVPDAVALYPDEPLAWTLTRSRAAVGAEDAPRGPDGRLLEDGRNVTVAIVDSGVDAAHPAFEGRVAASVRFRKDGGASASETDSDGHGTHVAGIALGNGAESEGRRLHGVAPGARLVALDISDAFTTTTAVRAFRWIHDHHEEHNVRVVSNSWGREKEDNAYDPDDPVVRASNALVADGLVVVFSAGNRGDDGAGTLTVEAANPNVIAVGATDHRGRVERYSSRGPARDADGNPLEWVKPDVVAPGTAIESTRSRELARDGASGEERHYTVMNGTSMAAPHVAAAAALLISKDPTLTPEVVTALLQGTARDVGPTGPDSDAGYGLLDVAAALQSLHAGSGRLITTVKIEPIRLEGELTGAEGHVVLDDDGAHVPPTASATLPLHVKDGTHAIGLHVNWTSPLATLTVTLVSPSGARTSHSPEGAGSVRVSAAAPSPGTWTLEIRPKGVAVATAYTVEGYAEVHETRALEPERVLAPRPRGLLGSGGFMDTPPIGALGAWLDAAPGVRLLEFGALAAVSALLLARLHRRRRRRDDAP